MPTQSNVLTWNVLHRVHAENWGEPTVTRWPDEAARIAEITARVAVRTEHVVALQEVSGDQLAGLRAALGKGRTFHTLRYPRLPRLRGGVTVSLDDATEFLVVLVDGPARPVSSASFDDDPGKGFLAVQTDRALVIGAHVGFGDRRTGHLAQMAAAAKEAELPVVMLGDFNADAKTVSASLGPEFTVLEPGVHALPTRPGPDGRHDAHIDHVVVRGAVGGTVEVEDADSLSDHNLLTAAIEM